MPAYPNYNMTSMLKQSGGPVTIQSLFIPFSDLRPETVDAIRNATVVSAVNKAVELWGATQNLIVRDMNADDMEFAANDFTIAAAAAVGWQASLWGAFTVATATVIGIYGIKFAMLYDGTDQMLPITGIRIDVGGSRHCQWHIQQADQFASAATTASSLFVGGVTKSPVIVAEDITVTCFEWTRAALVGNTYYPVWLGVVVEKEGVTLKP